MQPSVQYATTSDGVRIAFCTLGRGTPLVVIAGGPWATIELEWQIPAWRAWTERLARRRLVVRYDMRGSGLSDHAPRDFGLEAQLLDLEAVVDCLALERFGMLAVHAAGPAAIAFAARRPERVSHLVLWCSYPRPGAYLHTAQSEAIHRLVEHDLDLFTEIMTHTHLGWSEGETAHRAADLLRGAVTREMVDAYDAAAHRTDVTPLLAEVRVPTLVVQRRDLALPDVEVARALAAAIPGARLTILEGDSVAPFLGDGESALAAIESFLDEGDEQTSRRPRRAAEPLSERELAVLRLVDAGLTNQQIAVELVIALSTVKTHLASIYAKLDAASRTQALARARQHNLLP